jgi:hypothetical protein
MTRHCHAQPRRRPGVTALVVATATIIGCFESTLAQDPGRVTIDASRCREIESAEERLACFEAQVDAARGDGSAPPSPAQEPAPVPPQSTQRPAPVVDVADVPRQGRADDAPAQNEWVGTIASLKQREPNTYVITLESGEVWAQRLAARYPMRVGQRVRIYESKFGSALRLQAEGLKGFIVVDRVD